MFRRLWYNVRIALDYPAYEKQCRIANERLATEKYPYQMREQSLGRLRSEIARRSSQLDADEYRERQNTLASLQGELDNASSTLAKVTRDYKAELDRAYEEKSRLIGQKRALFDQLKSVKHRLSMAHSEKDLAYDRLNSAKTDVDDWYRKSKSGFPLYGNKGRKIPNHSLFGQSHGDLASAKNRRDTAGNDVRRTKSLIHDLKSEKDSIGSQIGFLKREIGLRIEQIEDVKNARQEAYEMKKNGKSRETILSEIGRLQELVSDEKQQIGRIDELRRIFIKKEEEKANVPSLVDEIENLKSQHQAMLSRFDEDEERKRRKVQHRNNWLSERGVDM